MHGSMHRAQYNSRKPWLVEFIANSTNGRTERPRMLTLMKSSMVADSSLCRIATDGQVSIKSIFTKACLLNFQNSWGNDTPPVMENVQIFMRQFELRFFLAENEGDCEFWLHIEEFSLADAVPAYFKGPIQNCMCVARVQEKVKLLWTQSMNRERLETDKQQSVNSTELSLLLDRMADSQNASVMSQAPPGSVVGSRRQLNHQLADSSVVTRFANEASSSESLADGQKFSSNESSPPADDWQHLTSVMDIRDFLISDEDARQLNAAEEWKDSYEVSSIPITSQTHTDNMRPIVIDTCQSPSSAPLAVESLQGETQDKRVSNGTRIAANLSSSRLRIPPLDVVERPELMILSSTQIRDTQEDIPPLSISPVLPNASQGDILVSTPVAASEYLFERNDHPLVNSEKTAIPHPGDSQLSVSEPCGMQDCILHNEADMVLTSSTAKIADKDTDVPVQLVNLQLENLRHDREEEARLLAMLLPRETPVKSRSPRRKSAQVSSDSPVFNAGNVTAYSLRNTPSRRGMSQSPRRSSRLTPRQVTSTLVGVNVKEVSPQSPKLVLKQVTSESRGLTAEQVTSPSPRLTSGQITSSTLSLTNIEVTPTKKSQSPQKAVTSNSPAPNAGQTPLRVSPRRRAAQSPQITSAPVDSVSPCLTDGQVTSRRTPGQTTTRLPPLTCGQLNSPEMTCGQVASNAQERTSTDATSLTEGSLPVSKSMRTARAKSSVFSSDSDIPAKSAHSSTNVADHDGIMHGSPLSSLPDENAAIVRDQHPQSSDRLDASTEVSPMPADLKNPEETVVPANEVIDIVNGIPSADSTVESRDESIMDEATEAPPSGPFKRPASSAAGCSGTEDKRAASARNKRRTVFTPAQTLMETVPGIDKLHSVRRTSSRLQKKQPMFDSSVMFTSSTKRRGRASGGKRSRKLYTERVFLPEHIMKAEPDTSLVTSFSDRSNEQTTTRKWLVASNVEDANMDSASEMLLLRKNLSPTKPRCCDLNSNQGSGFNDEDDTCAKDASISVEHRVSCKHGMLQTEDSVTAVSHSMDMDILPAQPPIVSISNTNSAATCDVHPPAKRMLDGPAGSSEPRPLTCSIDLNVKACSTSMTHNSHFDPSRIEELLQADDSCSAQQVALLDLHVEELHSFATEYFKQTKPVL